MKMMISMLQTKHLSIGRSSVHFIIWFRKVSSINFLFILSGERSVDRLIVIWVIRLSVFVHMVCSFSCSSAYAFVLVSGLFSYFSICPFLLAINKHKNVIND